MLNFKIEAVLVCCGFLLACTKSGKDTVMINLETSAGKIMIELDRKAAPITTDNFVKYAQAGFYDGTIFHRVIDSFMIQGGGFDAKMNEKQTQAPIKNEAANGLKNKIMTVAMARTQDSHSATAQFFINVADNTFLDYVNGKNDGYAVFGKVVEGQDVVNKIAKVSTQTVGYYQNVPVESVVILKANVINSAE